MLLKGIGLGVVGIIGTEILEEDLEYLETRHHTIPVIEVDSESAKKIASLKGKKVHMDAQVRVILFIS
jgi:hypothetical protein